MSLFKPRELVVIGRVPVALGRDARRIAYHAGRCGNLAKNSLFAIVWGAVWLAICDKGENLLTVYDVIRQRQLGNYVCRRKSCMSQNRSHT